MTSPTYVLDIASLTLADAEEAGGKAANLGEMTAAELPVPEGFVLLRSGYRASMEAAGVSDELAALHTEALRRVDDAARLDELCARMQDLVCKAGESLAVRTAVLTAYRALGADTVVAVRSSATGEDGRDASFAGMNRTITNVIGEQDLAEAVTGCWASLFTPRVLTYRASRGFTDPPAMAVVVQRMIAAERAGVAFTADPATGDIDRVVIEAAFGQGEVVVSGQVTPDTYLVDKTTLDSISIRIGYKPFKLVRGPHGHDVTVQLAPADAEARVLGDAEVRQVARLAVRSEAHAGTPQDVEWAIADGVVWLVQTRPITTLAGDEPHPARTTRSDALLLRGLPAAPGRACGLARVLNGPDEGRRLADAEILVAATTSPDWLPTMKRAAGVITESGGMTCHAAIVARELGIPCVVGARSATSTVVDGAVVTVDGGRGEVFSGRHEPTMHTVDRPTLPNGHEITGTKIYVNLAMPDAAAEVAAQDVDGVGLLRAEFMLTEALGGRHPRAFVVEGSQDRLVASMAAATSAIAAAFHPRPVIYRAIDFRSNEFRGLIDGKLYEPVEHNPMIGYRGCYRYVHEPDLFQLELCALARVRERYPNVHLMIPFVRTGWELEQCLELVDKSPLGHQHGLHRWVMAEVPSVVHWLPTYIGMGIDGVSIGSNDLTQLVLGVDRDSEICSTVFDTADPAVLDVIGQIIATARRNDVTSSLCGQAPSNDPAFAEYLVRMGITSISVNPDSVAAVRRSVAAAERRVLLDRARRPEPVRLS